MLFKIIQIIKNWIYRHFVCNHNFVKLAWHGLPGEPDLMKCTKCQWVTRWKDLLINHN